ncbi:SMI1/KNR4 family protein [Brevibacillus laterosporus]|nr:SMI1/KNR4 family protein [Brevibacillus laterosporus]
MGGEIEGGVVTQPATIQKVEEIEKKLGVELPLSFRETLLQFSSKIQFSWSLKEDVELIVECPHEFRKFSCDFGWDLGDLISINRSKNKLIKEHHMNTDDPISEVWHNKFIFCDVGKGDFLAFDLAKGPDCPVVYLSHNNIQGHGYLLGNNFIDFMDRWTAIGCPGPTFSQLNRFVSSPTSRLDPNGAYAKEWINWISGD